ncbi:MAG: hypothetical protein O2819_07200 [Planctomycetota bacterium]|nr:hypothetical protein [Planctomycetota bacterium]MDA1106273.1 hypothetical protein [Planctomycetota bacterium]
MTRVTFAGCALSAFVAGVGFAQCDVTPPAGSLASTDGCSHDVGDPNGGCNYGAEFFEDLGTVATGSSVSVSGSMGTYIPTGGTTHTSRDLDWFTVATTEAGTLSFDLKAVSSTGVALANTVAFIIDFPADAIDCVAYDVLYGFQVGGCPHAGSSTIDAGLHAVIVTVPFETDAAAPIYACDSSYLLTVSFEGGAFGECGTSADSCIEVHATGGCMDFTCCETVCSFNPLCCFVEWDQSCVDQAVTDCGYFIYNCPTPVGAGDCMTGAVMVTVGDSFGFDNTQATTDGPGPTVSDCGSAIGKDRWYVIQSPGDGALTLSACAGQDPAAPSIDSAIEVYALGTDPVIDQTRAEGMLDNYIGCVDDSCGVVAGTEGVTLIDAVAGDYYLFRVGGYSPGTDWPNDSAVGTAAFDTSFEYVAYTTGPQKNIINTTSGAATNLGLSSGCIAATFPDRWLAMPFTLTAPEGATGWQLSELVVKGFAPAGVTNETMNWVIWSRNGIAKPLAADQVASGSVAFPVPYDDGGDSAANASHSIPVDVTLDAGDYYLTAYASNAACGSILSNFAWFIYSPNGISLIDATGPFSWRSVTQPSPGFVRYTLPANYVVQTGDDPNDLYNCAFNIFGTPEGAPACTADLNGDGVRDGADLALLLGGWGTPSGDVTGDDITDGEDLAALLGVFGTSC